MTLDLRPYQLEAIEKLRAAMRVGARRPVLVMPTGSGKTRTAAAMVAGALARNRRVLWLAHRVELVRQSAETLLGFGIDVGVIAATERHLARAAAPVQVASLQTLLARETVRPPADLVIADECHHFSEDGAETWSALLRAYDRAHVVGLTATPERGDGAGLAPMFDALVVGIGVRALTQMGFLVPCEILRPSRVLGPGEVAKDPVQAFLELARGRQTILFARTVELAREYAARLDAEGICARAIHESTPPDERSLTLREFRDGRVRVLTNVYVLTEGTDLPMASCAILARGASKPGIFLQMVGRILRPADGKTDALLLDLRGVSHVHGPPEDERIYSLDGRAITRVEAKCPVCSSPRYGVGPHPDGCRAARCASDAMHCPECGYLASGEGGPETDTVVDEPLTRYARKLAEGPEQRRESLCRWAEQYAARGMRPGAAWHKFLAVYGERPKREWWRAAKAAHAAAGERTR